MAFFHVAVAAILAAQPAPWFYLHPFREFPLTWQHCGRARSCSTKFDHAAFAWAALIRHPRRTLNLSLAQLAVIPVSFDLVARDGCDKDTLPNAKAAVANELVEALSRSQISPAARHIAIATDFKTNDFTKQLQKSIMKTFGKPLLWAQRHGIISSPSKAGCAFTLGRTSMAFTLGRTSIYAEFFGVRHPAHNSPIPSPRFDLLGPSKLPHQRAYPVWFAGQVDARSGYADRRALFEADDSIPGAFIVSPFKANRKIRSIKGPSIRNCASDLGTDRCATSTRYGETETQAVIESSNYTLAFRGDTVGSQRFFDGMAGGAALIAIVHNMSDLDWLPYQSVAPWQTFITTIPRSKYREDPVAAINGVIKAHSPQVLAKLQELGRYYTADIDWAAHMPRAPDNFLKEACNISCSAHPPCWNY